MRTENEIKDMARAQTRLVLGQSTQFLQMPPHEQQALYRDAYEANYGQLARQNGLLTRQMATDAMDPENFDNDRIEQAGQLAADFIQDVDFPGFVRDLIHGVFRANIEVMHEQTNDFLRILKMATQSLAQFINKIDDTSTFAYLVDKEPDNFSFQLPPIPDDGTEVTQPQQPVLTDKQGEPLDIGDNMVKAKIMDAKIAMAQEQRALLREVMLMGITRLVVEEGNINAAVVFDIKAKENIVRTGQKVNEKVNTSGGNFGGSFLGIFGGGRSSTEKKTEITVSSAKGTGNTELAAKITGSVSIKFKTDYFKLDNFAQMYAPKTQPAAPAPGAAPAPAALPGAVR
ncbi:MAG: hypothetical protein H8F28_14615 [Fibrella sp.]|nr:hypothetical protein [Armatimonadota bacterium]